MNINVCDNPIFVLGPPRSGTSMMQWALRQHPRLWGGQESDFLIPLVRHLRESFEFGNQRGKLHWLSGQGVSWEEFLYHVGLGINSLYMSRSEGLRWVEQTPEYTLHLDDMIRLFPGAQFVFMVRDGREVVTSLRNFVNPVEHRRACRIWHDFIQAGLDFKASQHGDQLLMVSYGDAVQKTEDELSRVYGFLGEAECEGSVEFIKAKEPINSSFSQNGESRERMGWKHWSDEERAYFDDMCGPLMGELGFR